MEITITFVKDVPLYRQLYLHIRTLIQNGIIKDGAKLPSIRALMQQLNISKTTVETAYHMLLEEGYVQSKERSGLIVISPTVAVSQHSSLSTNHPASPIHKLVSSHSSNQSPDQASKPTTKQTSNHAFQALTGSNEGSFVDFNLLAVDGDSFPTRLWKSTIADAISLHNQSIHHYGDPRGEYELRESIAEYLYQSRGVICSPDQIIIGSGISYSIQLLSRLLVTNIIGIEKFGIAQVRAIFSQNKFMLQPISMTDIQTLEQELKEGNINMLYVTPSHRTSGDPMPYPLRQQLLQWANQNEGYIIEDDYDGELRLYGQPIPAMQSLDSQGVVIYIGTFSKVFTPALRMNYMVLPLQLCERLATLDHSLSPPSRIDQWAMQLFISRGHWYRHLRKIRRSYRSKHQHIIQLLQQYLPNSVHIKSNNTGLHVELLIKSKLNTAELIDLARINSVIVYGGHDNDIALTSGIAKLYLGFGGIGLEEMERGVRLLGKAWLGVT